MIMRIPRAATAGTPLAWGQPPIAGQAPQHGSGTTRPRRLPPPARRLADSKFRASTGRGTPVPPGSHAKAQHATGTRQGIEQAAARKEVTGSGPPAAAAASTPGSSSPCPASVAPGTVLTVRAYGTGPLYGPALQSLNVRGLHRPTLGSPLGAGA